MFDKYRSNAPEMDDFQHIFFHSIFQNVTQHIDFWIEMSIDC